MPEPLDTAYAPPKAVDVEVEDLERSRRRLAVAFLVATEIVNVSIWLVRVVPLMWMWGPDVWSIVKMLIPRIANGFAALLLWRGRRRIVWLPVGLAAWAQLLGFLNPIPSALLVVLELGISVLYTIILLALVPRRPIPVPLPPVFVGFAVYAALVVIEWFNPIVLEIPWP